MNFISLITALINFQLIFSSPLNISLYKSDKNLQVDTLVYYWPLNENKDNLVRKLELQLEFSNEFESVIQANISVSCDKLKPSSSATILSFHEKTIDEIESPKTYFDVDFVITASDGKEFEIICEAKSLHFDNQTLTNHTFDDVKTSIKLKVTNYPTISFEPTQTSFSQFELSPFRNPQLNIFFRDEIKNETMVNLTCEIRTNEFFISFVNNSNLLHWSTIVSNDINKTRDINLYITNKTIIFLNPNISVNIICSAESNEIGVNQQYRNPFAHAQLTVKFRKHAIQLKTEKDIQFSDSILKIPIILSPNLYDTNYVKVECGVTGFTDLNQLIVFEKNIEMTKCPRNFVEIKDAPSFNSIFDFYIMDESGTFSKIKEFSFNKHKNTNTINLKRIPSSTVDLINFNETIHLYLFCCDSTYLDFSNRHRLIDDNILQINNRSFKYSILKSNITFDLKSSNRNTASASEPFKTPTNSQLLDPTYEPCNCDLILNKCDMNCCCDPICTENDFNAQNIKCKNKIRNFFEKTVESWTCNDIYDDPKLKEPDWFPIICVNTNTTVLLGKFYSPKKFDELVKDNDALVSKVEKAVENSFNFRSKFLNDPTNGNRQVTQFQFCSLQLKSSYTYGSCLKTSQSDNLTSTNGDPDDFLRFPQSLDSFGTCIYNKPLMFLKEQRSFCYISVNKESCSKNSYLNYNDYINKIIFKNIDATIKINDTDIEYYKCTKYLTNDLFQQPADTDLTCAINSTSTCTLSAKSKLFDADLADEVCKNDQWTYSADRTNKLNIKSDYYAIPDSNLCQKLTTKPNSVELSSAGICTNAVIGVKYLLIWNGGSLTRIFVRVLVTDVTVSNGEVKQSQIFETKWLRESTVSLFGINSMSDYDKEILNDNRYSKQLKSGNKGYFYGRPLISGYMDPNKLNDIVDTSLNKRVSNFKILNGKLCGTYSKLERDLVKFGQNSSSTCIVRLSKQDLNSESTCKCVQRILFHKLNDYFMPSNFISKNGEPNLTSFVEADWISVYPKDRSLKNDINITSSLNTCFNVPYKMSVLFFYAEVGKIQNEPIYEIVGSYVRHFYRNWSFVCKSTKKDCLSKTTQDFTMNFQINFVKQTKKNFTWLESCRYDPNPAYNCIQQVLFTWPNDYNDPNFFYLYAVHLGLIFAVFSLIIFYVMIFGFVCPC